MTPADRAILLGAMRRNWLEIAAGLLLVVTIALLLLPLPKGVVAARRIAAGADITPGDLTLVPMAATPELRTTEGIAGLVAQRTIAPGEPIRKTAIGSAYAVAARSIGTGSILQAADAELEPHAYVEDGFRDLTFAGRPAATTIPKGSVIRASMVGPLDPRPARALSAIEPYRFLTRDDVDVQLPPRTCAVAVIAKGAIVRRSVLVTIAAEFDRIMTVALANGVPRQAAGSHATLIAVEGTGTWVPVQILSVAGEKAVVAFADTNAVHMKAEKFNAVQEPAQGTR